jgi:lipid A 3-O-deacylase
LLLAQESSNPYFAFKWANDTYFQTDYYFSNGFVLQCSHESFRIPFIDKIMPGSRDNAIDQASYSLVHDLYTPMNKDSMGIIYDDRPFASYLLLNYTRDVRNPINRYGIRSTLTIGLLGKGSGGEFVQNGIHSFIPRSGDVVGWRNELATDICLNYSLEIQKELLRSSFGDVNIVGSGSLGVPYTNLDAGFRLRLGLTDDNFSQFDYHRSSDLFFYLFAESRARVVLYDATFQGGLLNNSSPHTLSNLQNFVLQSQLGLTFKYDLIKLDLVAVHKTKEFSGGMQHKWLYFNLGFCL